MLRQIRDALLCVFVGTLVALSLTAVPLFASQNALFNSTTGPLSGLNAVQTINNGMDSLNTCNSGASAPSNQLSGSPSAGNCWYNTSTGAVSYYDGANWLTIGYIDATNHLWTPVVGGNNPTTVASATTTSLCGSSGASPIGAYLTISGTTTITGFGSNCVVGQIKYLTFSGALQLTYNSSSMIIPGQANLTTVAGDAAAVVYLGSSNWKFIAYIPISGSSPTGASLTAADQTLSGGANVTSQSQSSGNITVDCGSRPLQYITASTSAWTITAPSNDGACALLVTNPGGSPGGAITYSGFTVGANTGDSYLTTISYKFILNVVRINGVSTYTWKALQ
jgi:hypothetical protein